MPAERQTPACSRDRAWRFAWLFAAGLLLVATGASSAGASTAIYDGNSADGKVGIFTTSESLVPGDTDHVADVYERSKDESLGQYVTREVSIGPTGGNDAQPAHYDAASADGTKVFFSTLESLVSGDTDKHEDIYMRDLATNTTTWVSQGAESCAPNGCGNGGFDTSFASGGSTPDGNRLFFLTQEKLAGGDTDGAFDIYMRDLASEETTLVSQGAPSCASSSCGNGSASVFLDGVSSTGTVVVFHTEEELSAEDTDGLQDIYARNLGTESTSLVSSPGTCPSGQNCSAAFAGMASNGSHVFFETRERIAAGDTDESQDIYDWTGGAPTLASIGAGTGNGANDATRGGNSADGGAVYFHTSERLDAAADTDEAQDVYERSGGVTTLVSKGPGGGNGEVPAKFEWTSPDGSSPAVIFTTQESLTAADTDTAQDVYERSEGVTTLLSTGPEDEGVSDALFAGASHDGTKAFFVTSEPLVPEDNDLSPDIYERSGAVTTLISTGPLGGAGEHNPGLEDVSENGEYAYLTTDEALTEGDHDAEPDVYVHTPTGTLLVSTGNGAELGPRTPTLTGTNPASPNASTTPSIVGTADAETSIKIYTTFDCSKEPVATVAVEEMGGSGIPVTVAVGSTTNFRATAEAEGIVSPCSGATSYTQEDPPPPPEAEGGTGSGSGSGGSGSNGSEGSGGRSKTKGGVTYVTPETVITFGPSFKTRKRRPVFRFDDATGQPGSDFFCRIDRHRWRSCSSPQKLRRLAPGKHTFQVQAVNAVGVSDSAPDRRTFKVVR